MSTRSRARPWFVDERQLATKPDADGQPLPLYDADYPPPAAHDCFWFELQHHEDMLLWYRSDFSAGVAEFIARGGPFW